MMKAPAPITGGINCPPVDAAASIPAAKRAGKPAFCINGIVMTPVDTVFATDEPDTDPIKPEPKTATKPGPPTILLAAARDNSMMKSPAPDLTRKAPNKINMKTKLHEIREIEPNIPSVLKKLLYKRVSKLNPGKEKGPEIRLPQRTT